MGKKTEILLEEETQIDGKAYMIGHTREYVKAVVPLEKGRKNQMAEGVLTEMLTPEILLLS